MPKVKLFQLSGGESDIEVPEQLAEGEINRDLLYRAIRVYLTNQRQGTRATKMRSQVSGSGKKPWPQKHTGRARHGDRQSPLWAGGGVTFGPQPKDFSAKLPKKMKQRALASALRDRYQGDAVIMIDKLEFAEPKTKDAVEILERVGISRGDKALVLISEGERDLNLLKSFANIQGVTCELAIGIHPYQILNHKKLLVTSGGLEELASRVN